MKYIFFLIFLFFSYEVSAYSYIEKRVGGYVIHTFHIQRDDGYEVVVSASDTAYSLSEHVRRVGGVAGVNGAFFSPRDYTGTGDVSTTIRIVDGDGFRYSRYFPDTGVNGLFGFLQDGTPLLIQKNIYGDTRLQWDMNAEKILEVQYGIANFPILLASGSDLVPRYREAGLITPKMESRSTKGFICRTISGDIKMGSVDRVRISQLPRVLKRIGCIDGIHLDSGGSLAHYDDQRYRLGPGRDIMDAFVIREKR